MFFMQAAPKLENDAERVRALRALKLLDTPPEERFDRLVNLAARVFRAPMAYISLVDANRQWLKSSCGLASGQTGRDISFCGHTIQQSDMLVIPNATKDIRFADNPLVTEDPHVVFYAGMPLQGPMGHPVGTFCIADSKPREFASSEQDLLREIAALAERELNLGDALKMHEQVVRARDALLDQQKTLLKELRHAGAYVRARLPRPITTPIEIESFFQPCDDLGGDAFNYFPLNDRQFVVYLLDVCGHGVAAALLSVSIMNMLAPFSLFAAERDRPSDVIAALNQAYRMEDHDHRFFTLFYGVYDLPTRKLRFANAAHPPPIILNHGSSGDRTPTLLEYGNLPVGAVEDTSFDEHEIVLEEGTQMAVFSDGLFEVIKSCGNRMSLRELVQLFGEIESENPSAQELLEAVKRGCSHYEFEDDVSLLKIRFT